MKLYATILTFFFFTDILLAQDSTSYKRVDKKVKYYPFCIDSAKGRQLYIYFIDHGSIEAYAVRRNPLNFFQTTPKIVVAKKPFLKIRGNILYDVTYYSNIDTPFNQKDVYQHTVQVYLDITVKDHYPIRLYFTTRFGNALFFKDFTDANLVYQSNLFVQPIKDGLKRRLLDSIVAFSNLDSIKTNLDLKYKQLDALKPWQNNPAILQELVEARERIYFQRKREYISDSFNNRTDSVGQLLNISTQSKETLASVTQQTQDSIPTLLTDLIKNNKADSILNLYETKQKKFDSLKTEISILEKKYNEIQQQVNNLSSSTIKAIDGIKSSRELQEQLKKFHIEDSAMPKGYKTLMALRTVGIGRNIVNYSELSVKNISVTGIQVEYNPSYYVAFAAGTVDYRFRDFIMQPSTQARQYVGVVRVGKGMRDGNNIILTYYAGRKQIFNSFTDTINDNEKAMSPYVMGFTIEGNYKLAKNHVVTAEVAKSSLPYYATNNKSDKIFASAIKFNDRSNEAYSIKVASFFDKIGTRINAYYKHFGINFQSYSIFTNGSSQSAFKVQVEQPFFKRTLNIVASVNANDFSNPYIPEGYKSSTIFKSVQATLRKKNFPVISVGYFPSSQITKLNNSQYIQNLFYTLVGSVSEFYRVHNTMYSTLLFYTKFYNNPGDTNFVYFNTKNVSLTQNIFLRRFTLQFSASEAANNYYRLYEAGGNVQFKWNNWLNIGGGTKYNIQTVYGIHQIAYSGNATIKIPVLGDFTFLIDRGFIPGPDRRLVTNTVGRFTYFKSF